MLREGEDHGLWCYCGRTDIGIFRPWVRGDHPAHHEIGLMRVGLCIDCRQMYSGRMAHCRQCHETFMDKQVYEWHIDNGRCWTRTALMLGLTQHDGIWMRAEDAR